MAHERDGEAEERKQQRRKRQRELRAARRKAKHDRTSPHPQPPDTPLDENPLPLSNKAIRARLTESDITGLKYFEQLKPLLERLHDDGCERDTAGNRELHFDQYCLLILLYLFNPVVTSLRGIQQASELGNVQKKLGCQRAALGSLSEATSVFNAERLKEIIAELGDQLTPLGRDARLQDIDHTLEKMGTQHVSKVLKMKMKMGTQHVSKVLHIPGLTMPQRIG